MQNIKNPIFNVNNDIIEECKNMLNESIIINKENNNKLQNICGMILSNSALFYKHDFLILFYQAFKELYENDIHKLYKLKLSIIDKRHIENKNNECVFINKILCFSFVIKILSNERNGNENIIVESNFSQFINDNFIFNNSCPHFSLFITKILNINNNFCSYRIETKNNSALIYHYIEPFEIKILNKVYKLYDLNSLLEIFINYSHIFDDKYVSKIIYNILFQLIYSLCGLSKYNINHNDLRTANILLQGGYQYNNNVDHYKISIGSEKNTDPNKIFNHDFYVPNYGFKVKIIDYGLTSSDIIKDLDNPTTTNFDYLNCAGIFNIFSDIYDIHSIINQIIIKLELKYSHLDVYYFMHQIINKEYVGTNKSNVFINEFWRLGFPFTIKYYISKVDTTINTGKILSLTKLQYDDEKKLIVSDELKNNLINYIKEISKEKKLADQIINMIDIPLDNYPKYILKPIDAIKLFNEYKVLDQNISIINNYSIILIE
jgi:serine/threonine protein kinase